MNPPIIRRGCDHLRSRARAWSSGAVVLLLVLAGGCGVRESRIQPPPGPEAPVRAAGRTGQPPAVPPMDWPAGASLMDAGGWNAKTPAMPPARIPGSGLRFTCPFAAAPAARAVWDLSFRGDLRDAAGFSIRFRSRDLSAAGNLFFYLRSGAGWYGTTFRPEGNGNWETLTVWKHACFQEGAPQGWGRIDALRISVTPAAARNAVFEIAEIRAIPGDPRAVILRNTAAPVRAGSPEARSLTDFPERLGAALVRAGIPPLLVDDPDVADGFLVRRGVKTVLLPYVISLPPESARAVQAHAAAGGAIGGFFAPPAFCASLLEFRTGPYVQAGAVPDGFSGLRMAAAETAAGAPAKVGQASWIIQDQRPASPRTRVAAVWEDGRGNATAHPALLVNPRGFWMSHVYLDNDPEAGSRLLLALLARQAPDLWKDAARRSVNRLDGLSRRGAGPGAERVAALREQAREMLDAGRFPQALALASETLREQDRAWLDSLQPLPGEVRGAWCHRPYGIAGWSWDQTVRTLKAGGFNTLYANLAWPGDAAYASRVLPVSSLVREKGDQLRQCAAACQRQDIRFHVWISCLNLGENVPAAWQAGLRRDGRLQVRRDGTVNPRWLCPSHPANRRLLTDAMRELALQDGVDGIHLDFIRYQDADHCFCETCHRQFEAWSGRRVARWPADLARDPSLQARWLEYRRNAVTGLVRDIAATVRAAAPRKKLSAAVFDNFGSSRDTLGQDTVAWCRNGWVDWVCPMDYRADTAGFGELVRRQQAALADTRAKVYPGIGVRKLRLSAADTAAQILATRNAGTGGFTVFEFNADEAKAIFPDLARGVTRP